MVAVSPFVALRPDDDVLARSHDGSLRAAARAARRRVHPRQASWLEAWNDDEVAGVDEWIAEGALLVDERPTLRVVAQTRPNGHEMVGLLGTATLSDLVPHERTDEAAVRRRVARDSRQQVDTRPLLAVLPSDPDRLADAIGVEMASEPELDVVDDDGARHRVWAVPESGTDELTTLLRPVPCLLADGHHRAAAASTAGRREAMTLVTLASAPPQLLPVWRIAMPANNDEQTIQAWLDGLTPGDDVEVHAAGRRVGVAGDGVALPVETSQRVADAVPGVAQVTTSADPAAVAVAQRDGAVVVAAAAPSVTDVLSAIAAGRPLPPKSTAFVPKPRVGLTMWRR